MIDLIGWLASICFAVCGLPQAIESWKHGHSIGVSSLFLWLWFSGEVLMMLYIPNKHGWDWPLMLNLILNTSFICVIIWYKYFPRRIL